MGTRVSCKATLVAAALAVLASGAAAFCVSDHANAQGTNPTYANVIPGSESVTIQARIAAIDPQTRTVTLAGRSGARIAVEAGPAVRMNLLKVGDTVTVQYYRSVAFLLSSGGAAVPEDEMTQVITRPAQTPGGIGVRKVKLSGLVVGIDMASHSVDLVPPSGGAVVTVDVTDPERQAALAQVKVGDTVTAVVSEAVAVSITPAGNGR